MSLHFVRMFSVRMAICLGIGTVAFQSAHSQDVQNVEVFSFGTAIAGDEAGGKTQVAVGGPGGISFASGPIIGGSPFGVDPNNRSALFNLLSNDSIRRELQLKDEQVSGVQKIMQETQKRLTEIVRTNLAAGNPNPGAGIRETMAESRKQAEAAIEEILLPEQLTRVRQLAYQIEIAQLGLGESLVSGRLGKEIDVHEDQKQHLTDKAAAIEAEARLAIAKIRAAARDKLLAELAPEQRKKAEELLGPHFEYEEPSLAKTIRQRMKQVEPQATKK